MWQVQREISIIGLSSFPHQMPAKTQKLSESLSQGIVTCGNEKMSALCNILNNKFCLHFTVKTGSWIGAIFHTSVILLLSLVEVIFEPDFYDTSFLILGKSPSSFHPVKKLIWIFSSILWFDSAVGFIQKQSIHVHSWLHHSIDDYHHLVNWLLCPLH